MDHEHELNGISFVWDSLKARINLSKHSVTFERAAEAFFDPFVLSWSTRAQRKKFGMPSSGWMNDGICSSWCI